MKGIRHTALPLAAALLIGAGAQAAGPVAPSDTDGDGVLSDAERAGFDEVGEEHGGRDGERLG